MVYQYDRYPGMVTDAYVPDRLIGGHYPLETDTVTIAAGAILYRGSLLGQVTATGFYVLATSAASDGSQLPANWVVLGENIDTSATGFNAATAAPVYLSGDFDAAAMTFGAGITAAVAKAALRDANIYIKTLPVLGDVV